MSYKTANRTELHEIAARMIGPILKEVQQQHMILKAQQARFEVSLKALEARQDTLAAVLKAQEARVAEQMDKVLKRMAELENKL